MHLLGAEVQLVLTHVAIQKNLVNLVMNWILWLKQLIFQVLVQVRLVLETVLISHMLDKLLHNKLTKLGNNLDIKVNTINHKTQFTHLNRDMHRQAMDSNNKILEDLTKFKTQATPSLHTLKIHILQQILMPKEDILMHQTHMLRINIHLIKRDDLYDYN